MLMTSINSSIGSGLPDPVHTFTLPIDIPLNLNFSVQPSHQATTSLLQGIILNVRVISHMQHSHFKAQLDWLQVIAPHSIVLLVIVLCVSDQ